MCYLNLFSCWWRQQGSNLRPSECKSDALPAELCPQYVFAVGSLSPNSQRSASFFYFIYELLKKAHKGDLFRVFILKIVRKLLCVYAVLGGGGFTIKHRSHEPVAFFDHFKTNGLST